MMARHGIAQALSELVEEQWLSANDALALIEPIMNGNARRIFRLADKRNTLQEPVR
jgi:acyl carrier protein phosphodiesterase